MELTASAVAAWLDEPLPRRRYALVFAAEYVLFGIVYQALNRGTAGLSVAEPFLPFEERIPFITAAYPIYALVYVQAWLPLFLKSTRRGWLRLQLAFVLSSVVGFAFFALMPMQYPRPLLAGTSIFDRMLRVEWATDQPGCTFPSLHVAVAWILFFGLRTRDRARTWALAASATAVSFSTLLVKQHFMVDVLGGLVLGALSHRGSFSLFDTAERRLAEAQSVQPIRASGGARPAWPRRDTKEVRAIVAFAYFFVFWVFLPAVLWKAALALDRGFAWSRSPSPIGWAVILIGAALEAWGIQELWVGGGGLPVSALPPPRFTRRGPYHFMRHPLYVGFNLMVLGSGLAVGSRALAAVVTPAFTLAWLVYAWFEERTLVRRFGSEYRSYQEEVGILPRVSLYRLLQSVQWFRVLDVRVSGREYIPRRGPAILVFNHASYLDAGLVGTVTKRIIRHMTTAEVYRHGSLRWLLRWLMAVPVRRYRIDPAACRKLVRLLGNGELAGIAPEGERSILGAYQGALPDVASILSRLGVPVIPVGLSGAYDVGPRWSDVLRRRPVHVRAGPPIRFEGTDPVASIDRAIRSLIDEDPQRVHLAGLPREKLERVFWRCPACGEEEKWNRASLDCAVCRAHFQSTDDGWFIDERGNTVTFAALGVRVQRFPERERLEVPARAWREQAMFGAILPLEPMGSGLLVVSPAGVRFGTLVIPLAAIRSVSTERADTLQVATLTAMWQFRFQSGSAFRIRLALDRWRWDARGRPTANIVPAVASLTAFRR